MQRIVIPGEKLTDMALRLENTYIEGGKTYSMLLAVFDEERKTLTPLEGLWYPKYGDTVIGVVEEDKLNTYIVNLNSPYKGLLISKFVETELKVGDVIEATVKDLDKTKTAVLMRPRRLDGGRTMRVKPSKIPRIIGKANTMINQVSSMTKCQIIAGVNGIVWLNGEKTDLATAAILKIEEEAHTSGLTERVREMLQKGGI